MSMNLFSLSSQVAVVTGGGSGIGKAMAETLAGAEAHVVILGRTQSKIEEAADEISNETNAEVTPLTCDVTDKDQVSETVERIMNDFGRIDVLVNNAGTAAYGKVEDISEEDWEHVFNTNLKSAFLMTQAVVPHMKKANYGRIVNTASVAGGVSLFFSSVYGPSKAGLIHFTKQLSGELAPYGITVNAISPWFFKTDFNAESLEDDDFRHSVEQRTPVQRTGRLDELKTSVLYLAAPGSSYVNGQNIYIDGGMTSFGL
ncbi:SDR family NAD(P)-dependent oxidoreductase [Marinococcus luteus]|uniref:SDR family NAD(P)-dependent oxidoreductase n=1 Tax=Marinococcus luteus TaxID=1122204 RepID=UPI002ACCB56D|nr:SDR family oxidoreductase [Marinococcus luteus]MDZ5784453.1 SDR family oxidoreductase [Marinococcus luteus]